MKLLKFVYKLAQDTWELDCKESANVPWRSIVLLWVILISIGVIISIFNGWFILGVLAGYYIPKVRFSQFRAAYSFFANKWRGSSGEVHGL